MNNFYLFRTNLRNLEYYHNILNLESFILQCKDFYLLQGIYYLENNYIKNYITFRLQPENKRINPIIFDINGNKFQQIWLDNFTDIFNYPKADISFFRGGFQEYDNLTIMNPNFFGIKLYLGASNRTLPKWNGKYDKILYEDENDIKKDNKCIPFYKTANPNIFNIKNIDNIYSYDICFISNFSQLRYKGQEEFFKQISNSKYLQNLKICHIGNNSEIGINLSKKYNINNINFLGYLDMISINELLNKSKFGIIYSNKLDGNPRVITEILNSGCKLLLYNQTRILNYYKKLEGVYIFNDNNLEEIIIKNLNKKIDNKKRNEYLKSDYICELNWKNYIS